MPSAALAAPIMWPVSALMELTGNRRAPSPKTLWMAIASMRSFCCVPVP